MIEKKDDCSEEVVPATCELEVSLGEPLTQQEIHQRRRLALLQALMLLELLDNKRRT